MSGAVRTLSRRLLPPEASAARDEERKAGQRSRSRDIYAGLDRELRAVRRLLRILPLGPARAAGPPSSSRCASSAAASSTRARFSSSATPSSTTSSRAQGFWLMHETGLVFLDSILKMRSRGCSSWPLRTKQGCPWSLPPFSCMYLL